MHEKLQLVLYPLFFLSQPRTAQKVVNSNLSQFSLFTYLLT